MVLAAQAKEANTISWQSSFSACVYERVDKCFMSQQWSRPVGRLKKISLDDKCVIAICLFVGVAKKCRKDHTWQSTGYLFHSNVVFYSDFH